MTPNDVKIVAENIDDFIEVPDGIERLRKAVLALAVSGKLVAQDSKDGIAETLFLQIQAERSKTDRTTDRKKKAKESTLVAPEEAPFDIPKSWQWVRLGTVTNYGRTEKMKGGKVENGTWILELEDLEKDGGRLLSVVEYPQRKPQSDKNIFRKGDVLYGKLRPYLNKVIVAGRDGISSSELLPLRWYGNGSPEYLRLVMLSDYFFEHVNQRTYGMKMPRLGTEDGQNAPIPLPPLSEQVRIVKKAEELMSRIDELEVKKREWGEVRTRLARSAMQSLGKGESKIAFEHLSELVRTPADLKELEGALLTLAVSGQLAPQDEKDGVADELFKQIQSKRVKMNKQVVIEDKDELFPIPSIWSWVRLEDVFDVRDGTHDSPKYHTTGYPLVTSKNLYYGALDFLNVKYVSQADYKKINERSKVNRDDILFAMIGSIGNPVIVDTDMEFSIKNVALFKYYDRKLSEPNFLLTYLRYAAQNMRAVSAGGVQSFVSLGFLRGYPFPLPPLAEQKRIVKKVEEVMSLVDKLKPLVAVEK